MSAVNLTIGMATYDDFDGVYFSVMAMREYHSELLRDCELIVVDNNPGSRKGQRTKDFLAYCHGDFKQSRYIPYTETIGTAAPRDQVFRQAAGEYVCCVDSHVIFQVGALQSLLSYYRKNPKTKDLICGPIVSDDRRNLVGTHFTDVWRHGMWGVWGSDPELDIYNPKCKGTPKEIGAQGLGLFSCRKDRWLELGGFNPWFNGFGGEEWYIHEKFRKAGSKCVSIPQLRWLHRFNEGQPYPRTNIQKVRNYVLGHRELGLPLDRIHRHFVIGENEDGSSWGNDGSHPAGTDIKRANTMTESQWAKLIENPTPTAVEVESAGKPTGGCQGCQANDAKTLDELYVRASENPSDINEHCAVLRDLASQCDTVIDMGQKRGVSTTAMLAGQPKRLISYDAHPFAEIGILQKLAGKTDFKFVQADSLTADIEPGDMLFIDTKHTEAQFIAELELHHKKISRYIVRHDTVIFGETGDDGSPGLLHAVRRFVRDHPEWTVVKHYRHNHGLMVLSKDDRDKKATPNLVRKMLNYAEAVAKFIANGSKKVTVEQHQARLDVCMTCPLLNNGLCGMCGCPVEEKALWASEICPNPSGNLWPELPTE